MTIILARRLILTLGLLAMTACQPAHRTLATQEQAANVEAVGSIGAGVRFWGDSEEAIDHFFPPPVAGREATILALSGGSHYGAFGAGFLAGWTKSGERPAFTIVTGVSTGALIAPFAFLGPRYDDRLRDAFTSIDRKDIFRWRSPIGILSGPSLANGAPLEHLIEARVTNTMIDEIAAEHRRGRRLFIGTTNFDAQRPVIWDMGAIASSRSPTRYALFRRVLFASSCLPGLMPPVLIPITGRDGSKFDEMHFDGGVMLPIITLPEALLMNGQAPPPYPLTIFALINNRGEAQFDPVQPRIDKIAWRALDLAARSHAASIVQSTYLYAERHGMDVRLSFIDNSFRTMPARRYDRGYMQALYAYGVANGERRAWRSVR